MTDVVVDTFSGPLRGSSDGDITLFAGIPFAAPPVGELRFAPPQPVASWSDVREATEFAADPPQGASVRAGVAPPPTGPLAGVLALAAGSSRPWSEDCLYLNVWTPDVGGSRPVIVWIYGGGFERGSASPPGPGGEVLARVTGCVVVAMNYRVGALGFAHLADLGGAGWEGSTNLGLQDQLAALRWCRTNAAAFGGDPSRVTVGGLSAGAFCIGAMLGMPSATGLFSQAILQSGSTQRIFPAATGTAIAEELLAALHLDDIGGLRQVSAQQILDVQMSVIDTDIGRRNLPGGRSWGVVLDGQVVPEHPHDALARGSARDVAVVVGASRDEMRLFQLGQGDTFLPAGPAAMLAEIARAGYQDAQGLYDAYRERLLAAGGADSLGEVRGAFLSDEIYRVPATRVAEAQLAAGGKAWTALFSDAPFGPSVGACHGADMFYLFDLISLLGVTDPDRLAVRDELHAAWRSFATTGDPGWPMHRPGATRQFGGGTDLVAEPAQDRVTELRGACA
jgi:para-nitrobenzyl esterase